MRFWNAIRPRLTKCLLLAVLTGCDSVAEPPVRPVDGVHQHEVIPIWLLRCTTCHGPRRQEGGLDLRTPESALRGGRSGPAFVPGAPDDSLMIRRIESEACPPGDRLLKDFVRRPTSAELARLRGWISASTGRFVRPFAPGRAGRWMTLSIGV
jgi:hypothetical protein